MSKGQVQQMVAQLRAIATVVHALDASDLRAFIEDREHAMSIGPFMDPTAWMQSGFDQDRAIIAVAEATLTYKDAVEVAAASLATGAKS